MLEIQKKVGNTFHEVFGRTPLRQRLEDVFNEALELHRATDIRNMQEETGDTLASLLALCQESGWDGVELIDRTLTKIQTRKEQYKSLGRKTKVALFGGSFNPIHIGHFQTAKLVLDTSKSFDEVWFMPCYKSKYGKKLVDAQHRLNMCSLACHADARMQVSDYEIDQRFAGETYHFLKQLFRLMNIMDLV